MDTDTKPTDAVVTGDVAEQQPADGTKAPEAPAAQAAPPATDMPDWAKAIEGADAASLRKHPKVAGMIGSEAQRLHQQWVQQGQSSESQRVREATEAELLKFSEANADYLKENYPKAYEHLVNLQQDRTKREVEGFRGRTRDELAQKVGASIRQLPEFAELTQADHDKLVQAVIGKPDDEVIAIYNLTALDIAAEKRLAKVLAKETVKIREAVRQEEAAKLMKESDAPDLTKPKGPAAKIDTGNMSSKDFDVFSPPGESFADLARRLRGG